LVIALDGSRMPSQRHERIAAVGERADMGRRDAQEARIGLGCLLVTGERGKEIAALEPGIYETPVAGEYLVEDRKRLFKTAQPRQHDGAVEQGIEVARIDGDQAIRGRKRVVPLPERHEDDRQQRESLGGSWLELECSADELMGFAHKPLLKPNEREHVESIELTRVARQHGAVDRLRLGDPALAMQHHPVLGGRHQAPQCTVMGYREYGEPKAVSLPLKGGGRLAKRAGWGSNFAYTSRPPPDRLASLRRS